MSPFPANLIVQASQEEKWIAAWLHHKTEGKEISFQQDTPSLFLPPYRREDSEEGNAKRSNINFPSSWRASSAATSSSRPIKKSHSLSRKKHPRGFIFVFVMHHSFSSIFLFFFLNFFPLFIRLVESKCMRIRDTCILNVTRECTLGKR